MVDSKLSGVPNKKTLRTKEIIGTMQKKSGGREENYDLFTATMKHRYRSVCVLKIGGHDLISILANMK